MAGKRKPGSAAAAAAAAPGLSCGGPKKRSRTGARPGTPGKLPPTPSPGSLQRRERVWLPEDGCSWLKYGEKQLRETQLIRAYFKCSLSKTPENCPARKFVDFFPDSMAPSPPIVMYQGAHNHLPQPPSQRPRHPSQGHFTSAPLTPALLQFPIPLCPPYPSSLNPIPHHSQVPLLAGSPPWDCEGAVDSSRSSGMSYSDSSPPPWLSPAVPDSLGAYQSSTQLNLAPASRQLPAPDLVNSAVHRGPGGGGGCCMAGPSFQAHPEQSALCTAKGATGCEPSCATPAFISMGVASETFMGAGQPLPWQGTAAQGQPQGPTSLHQPVRAPHLLDQPGGHPMRSHVPHSSYHAPAAPGHNGCGPQSLGRQILETNHLYPCGCGSCSTLPPLSSPEPSSVDEYSHGANLQQPSQRPRHPAPVDFVSAPATPAQLHQPAPPHPSSLYPTHLLGPESPFQNAWHSESGANGRSLEGIPWDETLTSGWLAPATAHPDPLQPPYPDPLNPHYPCSPDPSYPGSLDPPYPCAEPSDPGRLSRVAWSSFGADIRLSDSRHLPAPGLHWEPGAGLPEANYICPLDPGSGSTLPSLSPSPEPSSLGRHTSAVLSFHSLPSWVNAQ